MKRAGWRRSGVYDPASRELDQIPPRKVLMAEEKTVQTYLGVTCQLCRQPIPVPAIVVSLEAKKAAEGNSAQVFTLRCRSCDAEHPYRSSDIREFQGTPKTRSSRARQARLLRQTEPKTLAANA